MNLDNFRLDKDIKDGFNTRCRKCQKNKDHKYYLEHEEAIVRSAKAYKRKNSEYYKEVRKTYNLKNKDKQRAQHKIWDAEHDRKEEFAKYRKTDAFKQSQKRSQEFRNLNKKHEISTREWLAIKKYFNNKCAYCDLPIDKNLVIWKGELKQYDFCKDHVDNNGANDLSNCVPACRDCNNRKKTIEFEKWYREDNNLIYDKNRYEKIMQWLTNDYKLYIEEKKPRKPYTRKVSQTQ